MKHFNVTVKGKVQNVGFRHFTNKRANELNVKGFVKNLPDGDVYIEAEAEENVLKTFLALVRQGPSWSRVDDVLLQEAPLNGFEEFMIK